MFNPANETHFSLSIEGLEHDLQVLEFSGREAISQPYRFEVELISENAELDLQSLLHQRAFLAFDQNGAGIRFERGRLRVLCGRHHRGIGGPPAHVAAALVQVAVDQVDVRQRQVGQARAAHVGLQLFQPFAQVGAGAVRHAVDLLRGIADPARERVHLFGDHAEAAACSADADGFDAGAKYHIPGNTPYTRYFLARILQFQFYKAACDIAGWKGPLHRCSFYGNKEVGKNFLH